MAEFICAAVGTKHWDSLCKIGAEVLSVDEEPRQLHHSIHGREDTHWAETQLKTGAGAHGTRAHSQRDRSSSVGKVICKL